MRTRTIESGDAPGRAERAEGRTGADVGADVKRGRENGRGTGAGRTVAADTVVLSLEVSARVTGIPGCTQCVSITAGR